jgi:hypothetical protein
MNWGKTRNLVLREIQRSERWQMGLGQQLDVAKFATRNMQIL